MKNCILIICALLLLQPVLHAQTKPGFIVTKNHLLFGPTYEQDGKKFRSMLKLRRALSTDPEATRLIRKANNRRIEDIVWVYVTGPVFLYCAFNSHMTPTQILGAYFAYQTPPFLFALSSNHFKKQAIAIYNQDLDKTACHHPETEYYLGLTGNSVGLVVKF